MINYRGQSMVQYTIVLSIVATVCVVMGTMLRRVSQGFIKVAADQLGSQQNAEQSFNLAGGYLKNSVQWKGGEKNTRIQEFAGNITYSYDDAIQGWSKTEIDMGFSEQ